MGTAAGAACFPVFDGREQGMLAGEVLRRMRELPEADLERITAGAAPLVVAPHPDDESLGCGGLITACCAAGHPPFVVFVTDGSASHPGSRRFDAERRCAVREEEARQAAAALGVSVDRLRFLRLPDSRAPHEGPDFTVAAAAIGAVAREAGSRAILAPWVHDPHGDHVAAHRMAAVAAAGLGLMLWSFPVWGWTLPEDAGLPGDAPRGVRLDVARHLSAKRAAVAAYRSQHGEVFLDDPDGFVLPQQMLAMFEGRWEVFLGPEPPSLAAVPPKPHPAPPTAHPSLPNEKALDMH